jgi:hypothetical protein
MPMTMGRKVQSVVVHEIFFGVLASISRTTPLPQRSSEREGTDELAERQGPRSILAKSAKGVRTSSEDSREL